MEPLGAVVRELLLEDVEVEFSWAEMVLTVAAAAAAELTAVVEEEDEWPWCPWWPAWRSMTAPRAVAASAGRTAMDLTILPEGRVK